MFRVVPDQLRISEGWVRCGQCDEVFDANAHLQTWTPSGATPLNPQAVSEPQPEEAQEPVVSEAQGVPEEPAYDWSGIDTGELAPEVPATMPQDSTLEAVGPAPDVFAAVPAEAMHANAADGTQDDDQFLSSNPHELPVAEASMAEQYVAAPPPDALPEPTNVPEAPLSFMPRDEKRPAWQRSALIAVVVLAAAALLLQLALFERNRLAAVFPAVAPVLQATCAAMGCSVAAPRQIDAFAIESSTFNTVKPGVYLLQITLKNSADLDLESPALELTLSDRQEQVVLRRSIYAAEYAEGMPVFAAGSERSFRIPLAVNEGVPSHWIAGYKVLAYYP